MISLALSLSAATGEEPTKPVIHTYATHNGQALTAHVFRPATPAKSRAAIVILHGGGWSMGEPSWGYGPARRFTKLGLVAISGQYRLSGSEHPGVTPIEAMADARALVRWVRSNSKMLNVNPQRIAGYGWSAGAHLIAATATWPEADQKQKKSCVPDAMILSSPAVSLHRYGWMQKLLGGRATLASISPDMHVRPGMPPTILLQGRTDTVTPLAGTQRFHDRMLAAKNASQLIIYDGVGHLFTPSTESDQGWPNPDAKVSKAARQATEAFLREQGFVD